MSVDFMMNGNVGMDTRTNTMSAPGPRKLPSILKSAKKTSEPKPEGTAKRDILLERQASVLPDISSSLASTISMEWKTLATQLNSDDDKELQSGLTELQKNTASAALETEPTALLLPLCMDKLQHHDIVTRGLALNVIANQMRAKNWSLERLLPDLAKKLAQPNLLDLKQGKSSEQAHNKLHTDLVYIITELHTRHPSQLMPVFKPIIYYMIDATLSSKKEISTVGCMFWGNLKVPPVPEKRMGEWLPPIFHKLNKLVMGLLRCMVYDKDYVQYMESQTSAAGERPRTSSLELQALSDNRNYAALGFEKLCRIYSTEVTPIFKLCIQKWLHSKNWLEQEAVILAIGAYCQAFDGPASLKDMIPDIMAQLLSYYQSKYPMLRSITCFTAVNFMNVRVKGMKDCFGRMLRGSLALINDENCEVQDQAMRALATLLAYGSRDLTPYSRKIVQALVKADSSTFGKSRFTYYECIGHSVGRLHPTLEEHEIASLTKPLLENWLSLNWAQDLQGTEEEITSLCSPLCAIGNFTGEKFAQHNETIVDKVAGFLDRISPGRPEDDPKSSLMTTHIVAYLDVLSALYYGQGSGLNEAVNKNKLPTIMMNLLKNFDSFREEVAQSSIALFGHICKNNMAEVNPMMDDFMGVVDTFCGNKSELIRSNALWAYGQACINCPEKNEKMLAFAKDLTNFFMNLKAQEGVVIHSATAFMYLAKRWQGSTLKMLFKDEVFTHLCALLQTQFSQDNDKIELFRVLCELISHNMSRIPKEGWVHFCASAAILDVQDEDLKNSIKNILKEVRSTVGNAKWNKINAMLGQHMAYNMRKKYKLY